MIRQNARTGGDRRRGKDPRKEHMAEPPLRFAAIGLDHRHIYHQVGRLLELGCECAGYWTDGDPQPLGGFLERFPRLTRLDDLERLLDAPPAGIKPPGRHCQAITVPVQLVSVQMAYQ